MMKKTMLRSLTLGFLMYVGVYAFGQYDVTFNVDISGVENFDPATTDVYITGGFAGWAQPGTNPDYKLIPSEQDSLIYTVTTTIEEGEIQYKYFLIYNGMASWDNGEWVGDPNRKGYVNGYNIFNDIWADKPVEVTFNLDMSTADPFDPATDDVFIAGDLASGWAQPGTIPIYMLSAVPGDTTMYTVTLSLYTGDYVYKYFRIIDGVPSWDNGEWSGDPNRTITVEDAMVVEDIWALITGISEPLNEFTYTMYPNPANDYLHIANVADVTRVEVYDVAGKLVKMAELNGQIDFTMNVSDLQTGLYVISVTNDRGVQTSKFIRQ